MPLPNPDVHETIGEKLDMKPSKVFFGINLIRQKLKLPKLDFPKRRLALTPDQLSAIETLYEPYLPLPPIGIHKIISKQLRMDEWRVHVGIGLVRKNRNMPRWNEDREDLPETMRVSLAEKAEREKIEQEKAEKEKIEKEKVEKEKIEKQKAEAQADPKAGEAPPSPAEDAPDPATMPEAASAEAPSDAPPSETQAAEAAPVKKPRGRPKKVAAISEPAADTPPAETPSASDA